MQGGVVVGQGGEGAAAPAALACGRMEQVSAQEMAWQRQPEETPSSGPSRQTRVAIPKCVCERNQFQVMDNMGRPVQSLFAEAFSVEFSVRYRHISADIRRLLRLRRFFHMPLRRVPRQNR